MSIGAIGYITDFYHTDYRNGVEYYQNVFGNSVASARQAAKELLYDLENPLTPESERSESVRMYREQEKELSMQSYTISAIADNYEEVRSMLKVQSGGKIISPSNCFFNETYDII